MITVEPCKVCRGAGRLDYYEERSGSTGDWHRRRRDEMPLELLEALRLERPDLLRLVSDVCEVCGGAGEYVLEHVRCKIF